MANNEQHLRNQLDSLHREQERLEARERQLTNALHEEERANNTPPDPLTESIIGFLGTRRHTLFGRGFVITNPGDKARAAVWLKEVFEEFEIYLEQQYDNSPSN